MTTAAARTAAIWVAKGGVILQVDSNDVANLLLIVEALRLFALHQEIDVVNSDCILLAKSQDTSNAEVVLIKLISVNILNVTAIFKKRVWKAKLEYSKSIVYGYEDGEF